MACPCRGKSGEARSSCQNCMGTGFAFVNPIETKAIITSINKDTKYKYWSPELMGTISVTTRSIERLSFMDRIDFKTRTSLHSEVKPVLENGSQKFIFTSYPVRKISSVFLFNSDSTNLIRLNISNYTLSQSNDCVIFLNGITFPTGFNDVVSIDYEHSISYNVIDIPHDIRSSFRLSDGGKNTEYSMPVQAVARRSHLLLGNSTNYDGNNSIDNSWK
jgi:hypothetical protein